MVTGKVSHELFVSGTGGVELKMHETRLGDRKFKHFKNKLKHDKNAWSQSRTDDLTRKKSKPDTSIDWG